MPPSQTLIICRPNSACSGLGENSRSEEHGREIAAGEGMRAKIALGALVLVAGLAGGGTARADDEPIAPSKGNWFTRMFVSEKKEPDAKTPEPAKEPAPSLREIHAQAEQELLRRHAICTRLREIANETQDGDLLRKADRLEERANQIYGDRVGMPSRAPIILPEDDVLARPRPEAAAPTDRKPRQ